MNAICNHDCFNCPYPDCIVDDLTLDEYKDCNERDREIKWHDRLLTDIQRQSLINARAREKTYREANKDKISIRKKTFRETNREKYLADRKTYYEANKEQYRASCKAWYRANRDKKLAYQKVYNEANKDKRREYTKACYEAKKLANIQI